jgi:hypothetical protein
MRSVPRHPSVGFRSPVRRTVCILALCVLGVGMGCGGESGGGGNGSTQDAAADSLAAADSATDAGTTSDGSSGGDGGSGCPASCPSGMIVVDWDDSAPGFPGPSGCACQPIPCDGGATGCSAQTACQSFGHSGGCDAWNNATLQCYQCG